MKNKKLLLFLGIIFIAFPFYAQVGDIGDGDGGGSGIPNTSYGAPSVIPPSPTVATLMQFEEVPVNLYTGIPDISIPIFGTNLDNNLGFSLALSYHPEGLRVDNRSSWTGVGWSVTGLGAVSRTVMGFPDESLVGILTSNSTFNTIDYEVYGNRPLETGDQEDYDIIDSDNKFAFEVSKGNLDGEPDIFQFNALGLSGRFMVMKGENGFMEAIQIGGDQKLLIDFITEDGIPSQGSGFRFQSFTITDENGYQYIFGVAGRERTYNLSHSSADNNAVALPDNYYNDSAWNLTAIKNYRGQTLLNVNYESSVEHYTTPTVYSRTLVLENPYPSALANAQDLFGPVNRETFQEISVDTKKISQVIIRNNDLITVDFMASGEHPEYFYTDQDTGFFNPFTQVGNYRGILNDIVVRQGGQINKTFQFNYGTIIPENRLILNGVTEIYGSESLPYTFDYNGAPRNFGTIGRDFWGYYNGQTPSTGQHISTFATSASNRAVNTSAITTGVLKSITYPTGGIKEFDFESNSFSNIQGLSHPPQPRTRTFSNINMTAVGHTDLGVIYINDLSKDDGAFNSGNLRLELTIDNIDVDEAENGFGIFLERVEGAPGSTHICPCSRETNPNPALDSAEFPDNSGDGGLEMIDPLNVVDYGIDNGFYDPADFPVLVDSNDAKADLIVLKFPIATSTNTTGDDPLGDGVDDNGDPVGGGGLDPSDYTNASISEMINLNCSGDNCADIDHSGYFKISVGKVGGTLIDDLITVTAKVTDYYPPNPNAPDSEFVNVLGGGLRIKEVRFNDPNLAGNTSEQRSQYEYTNFDNPGQSSGQAYSRYEDLNKVIYRFNFFQTEGGIDQIVDFPILEAHSRPVAVSAKGGSVGYSNVTVKRIDENDQSNGISQYTYTTVGQVPESSNINLPIEVRDYLFGNLIKQETFDDQGRILSSSENHYEIEQELKAETASIRFRDTACPLLNQADSYEAFKQSICGSNQVARFDAPCYGSANSSGCDTFDFILQTQGQFFVDRYNIYSGRALLDTTITKSYFYDESDNQKEVSQTATYSYNDFNNRISEQSVSVSEESPLITKYYYPADPEVNSKAHMTTLLNDHRISEVVKTESYQGDNILVVEERDFASLGGAPRVQFIKTQKQNGPLEDRIEYVDYDAYGNPLEARKADDSRVIFIWGYYSMYPLAQISHATYQNLPSDVSDLIDDIRAASNLENTTAEETNLRDLQNQLRNHPHFISSQVTTMTYDPIIGVTSQTDPRGYTTYYEYDQQHRLEYVKDPDGHIYSANEYYYKNQN